MATSRIPDALNALYSLLVTACAPVNVYYGPVSTDDPMRKAVGIGWNGDPEGDQSALEGWSQEWAGLGALRKDEEFEIVCYAISWAGDNSASQARIADVFEILANIENALRADPTLGLSQPFVADFANGSLYLEGGTQARVTFNVRCALGRI